MKLDIILKEEFTRESIKAQLLSDDRWVMRAILAIYQRQTDDERNNQTTSHLNNIGFSGVDAPFLSSLAVQLKKQKESGRPFWLSPKQMAIARNKMIKYTRQLLDIANTPKV